jgi:hypothetical protein
MHRYAVFNLMDKDTVTSDDVLGVCAVVGLHKLNLVATRILTALTLEPEM